MSTTSHPVRAVVVGGGIIGLTTAYYLLINPSLPPGSTVSLIERTAIGHAASGRAMGMIGREWHPQHRLPLSQLSWRCYEELDREHGGDKWEWMIRPTLGVELEDGAKLSRYRELQKDKGVDGEEIFNGRTYTIDAGEAMGHVNPAKFCRFLDERCRELGLEVHLGHPISMDSSNHVISVKQSSGQILDLPYSRLLVAAGPWSAQVCSTLGLPIPPISNLPGHSIHIEPSPEGWDQSLVGKSIFAGVKAGENTEEALPDIAWHGGSEDESGEGCTGSIEMISKPDGYVYIAGENGTPRVIPTNHSTSSHHMPDDPAKVAQLVDPTLVKRLCRSAAMLSSRLDVRQGANLVTSQLCYRPTSPDGSPLLGWLDEAKDTLLAAGHGPWGITLGPGSGRVMAELILGLAPSVSLTALRPSRFLHGSATI